MVDALLSRVDVLDICFLTPFEELVLCLLCSIEQSFANLLFRNLLIGLFCALDPYVYLIYFG